MSNLHKARVIVNGAQGRMGQLCCQTLKQHADFLLVGELGRDDNLGEAISRLQADIVIDVTSAHAVYNNTRTIITHGARPIIGSSGLVAAQIEALQTLSLEKKIGGVIAPNFSIGVVLMMKFAAQAAAYFPNYEIIEYHHDQKQDAPSGTALKTAEIMSQARAGAEQASTTHLHHTIPGSRGALHHNVPIHAIRLPGLVAHQTVLFGGNGETLSLRHDSLDRSCFMPGIILACQRVGQLSTLVYGLEHLLETSPS